MMFEEPLFSQLDSWGKGKTAHYLQTVIKARGHIKQPTGRERISGQQCRL
jgi:hypothetical protein